MKGSCTYALVVFQLGGVGAEDGEVVVRWIVLGGILLGTREAVFFAPV